MLSTLATPSIARNSLPSDSGMGAVAPVARSGVMVRMMKSPWKVFACQLRMSCTLLRIMVPRVMAMLTATNSRPMVSVVRARRRRICRRATCPSTPRIGWSAAAARRAI